MNSDDQITHISLREANLHNYIIYVLITQEFDSLLQYRLILYKFKFIVL